MYLEKYDVFSYYYIYPKYEGVSINNQPITFPMYRDGHDFHPLFQYMFYTWAQNCMRIESFFNKILNVNMASDAKACFLSKVEYRAVIRYLYLKGKTGKEIHGELADVYESSAPSYAQVKFWVGEFRCGRDHTCKVAMDAVEQNGYELIPHPAYSPDLAASDFFLFPNLKKDISALHFQSDEEVVTAVEEWVNGKDPDF